MSKPLVLTPDQIGAGIPAVLQLGQAHFTSQCLYAVIRLGVPDIIGDSKMSTTEIAKQLPGTPNQEALQRCMRILSLVGVFTEAAGEGGEFVFGLAPAGAMMQTKAPQPSMACGIHHWMEMPMWGAWSGMPDYVAGLTSTNPFQAFNKAHVFDFYAKHPESAAPFNEFMTFFSQGELPVIREAAMWKELEGKTVVDVGGNYGAVMSAVAEANPGINCVNFDLPEVIEKIAEPPKGVTLAKGDMFDSSTLPKGDVYFMKHILHDWNDVDSERILKSCHQALGPDGVIMIAEAVLPDAGGVTPTDAPGIYLDTLMMAVGGKERTQRQWEALAQAGGFKIRSVTKGHPTCHIIIMEKA